MVKQKPYENQLDDENKDSEIQFNPQSSNKNDVSIGSTNFSLGKSLLQSRLQQDDMNPRASFHVYPRKDITFKKKKSLSYDHSYTEIFQEGKASTNTFGGWVICFLIGVTTAAISVVIEQVETLLVSTRNNTLKKVFDHGGESPWAGWAFMSIWCIILGGLACVITLKIAPGAAGSGIAEIMGYLNGVNVDKIIGIETLIVKVFGVAFAISGQAAIGKEGPLVHIGTIVSMVITHFFPWKFLQNFQNDMDKREFAVYGIAAGVSAAFSAPIGGTLFSFELSRPATFWSFGMLWRAFFCSACSTYAKSILDHSIDLLKNKDHQESVYMLSTSGDEKFGKLTLITAAATTIHMPIILGIIAGSLGALFINFGTRLTLLRKKYLKSDTSKIIEASIVLFLTVSSQCLMLTLIGKCKNITDESIQEITWNCPKGQYNHLGNLYFSTEGSTIRNLFNPQDLDEDTKLEVLELLAFCFTWYFFTVLTYGVQFPAGLFLPGIIMGGGIGHLYMAIIRLFTKQDVGNETQLAALLGATAMLMSYTRMTYSLAVVMMETTQAINLFIPMLITMIVSYGTSKFFNSSIYSRALRQKQVPYLNSRVPKINKDLRACVIMTSEIVALPAVATVKELLFSLKTDHQRFPILNQSGQLIGVIPAHFLIVLIESKHWYRVSCENFPTTLDMNRFTFQKKDALQNSFKQTMINTIEMPLSPNQNRLEDLMQLMKANFQSQVSHNRLEGSSKQAVQKMDPSLQADLAKHLAQRQKFRSKSDEDTKQLKQCTKNLMKRVNRAERRCSEFDFTELPKSRILLDRTLFNSNFKSEDKKWKTIEELAEANSDELIDLRPYMILNPHMCFTTDRLQRVLDIFRTNHLRILCVINQTDGQLQGVISRENLFSYMSL